MPEAAKATLKSQKKLYHDMLSHPPFRGTAGPLYGHGLIALLPSLFGQEAVVVG